jgi:chromosome segregation ATPase
MSDISRFHIDEIAYMTPFMHDEWVRYDDHLAYVERLTAKRDEAQAAVLKLARQNIERFDEIKRLKNAIDHVTSERDDHLAEVGRLTAERNEAQAERDAAQRERERFQDLLTLAGQELSTLRDRLRVLQADPYDQINKARTQVEWLKYQVATPTGAMEQANKAKADAEAAAAREKAETDRVVADGNRALAEMDRLAKERNNAKADLEWLRATQSVQNLGMANGQAILDNSSPTDEDIWREAFMSAVHDVHKNWMDVADVALAQYRKRWPR